MTYVVSDIHGDSAAFEDVLEQIAFSAEDRLFIVGDVIDRGLDGIALLQRILKTPNMTLLLGNHELMMRQTLCAKDRMAYMPLWFQNGGDVTFRAFTALSLEDKTGLLSALSRLPLQLDLRCGGVDYRLVHAAPAECAPASADLTEFCVWTRLDPGAEWLPGKTVLFGHTPTWYYGCPTPLRLLRMKGKIALDCGSAAGRESGGRLGCLRLEDQKEFYSR